ncbi:MAG: tRNA lysidine(34) synthetase TilS, partial [Lachnospiraceae bacterium]|nr:tRNA lysidine(34) synthetase TilS [Lachnospiraceae bacterium]
MKIIDKVKKFIKEKDLINSDDKILVGVSGGVDSVVLFSILLKLKASMDLELYVVHVNHGIRGANATRDEEFVKSLCDKNNISFSVICEDVPTFAKENKLSEEEAGRIIRRRSFEKIREEIGFDKIALAHHIDDNVETFFLNICRGSGISGGRGMNSKNGYYIRPFLCLTRSEIEEYAGENNIEHIEDETNLEDEYTRNKIRHNILPYLTKEINKNSICHINSFMER